MDPSKREFESDSVRKKQKWPIYLYLGASTLWNNTSYYNQGCFRVGKKKRVKLSLQQAMKAHRVVRRRGSHIF
jgi:hypothetical protein